MKSGELSIGKIIRSYRESKGLSLRQLAKELGVTYTTLAKMEMGDQKIDSAFLLKIADYFNVSLDKMLNRVITSSDTFVGTDNNDMYVRDALNHILRGYLRAKDEKFKNHPMGEYVRNTVKHILISEAHIDEAVYHLTGSVGQGQWAEIPWISVFMRDITLSATNGYYIVYLFTADCKGVYVSLNQGWTYFKDKYGTKIGREKIRKTAALIREQLNTVPTHLKETTIDLKGRGELGKGYESGHIFGRYYAINALPSSEEIINDLRDLLVSYKELKNLMGSRSLEDFNNYLLTQEDGEFFETDEDEERYQESIQDELASNSDRSSHKEHQDRNETEEDTPKDRPDPQIDKGGKQRWTRSASLAARAIRLAEFTCEINKEHKTFQSKKTKEQYMESHHLVPIQFQDRFEFDLDQLANLLSLCSVCHDCIHYGSDDEKKALLKVLFDKRKKRLEEIGIAVSFDELKRMYGIYSKE
jgi:5-methylcytosine-specific restriction enzyme A